MSIHSDPDRRRAYYRERARRLRSTPEGRQKMNAATRAWYRRNHPDVRNREITESVRAQANLSGVSERTIWRRRARAKLPPPEMTPTRMPWETVQEAAARLGVSERTVYRRLAAGREWSKLST